MFKRKELETFADVVHDVGIRLFNMQDEADAMALAEILDGAQNSWRRIIDYRPEFVKQADGSLHCYVLCAWSTPYAELTDARRRSLEL